MQVLHLAVTVVGPSVGFQPSNITANSLQAGGTMALLCTNAELNDIRLIG